ncbi:MAG TPA: hypothetical protein VOA41_11380 [Candidatus Dormibacteraeota bacterium]|nr:hypothetical protein [Candidatus Dormibacteraeota bacterium]
MKTETLPSIAGFYHLEHSPGGEPSTAQGIVPQILFLDARLRPYLPFRILSNDQRGLVPLLDRLLHHGHILKCGPRSWRTKLQVEP